MNDWMAVPTTEAERQALVATIQSLPMSHDTALATLRTSRQIMLDDPGLSYEQIREFQGAAESARLQWLSSIIIRNEYDYTFLTGEWRVGQALVREEKAKGTQGDFAGRDASGRHLKLRPESGEPPTIAEKVGNRMMGWRLQAIAPLSPAALNSLIQEYHQREKQATLTGMVKLIRAGESEMRRMDSMTAPESSNLDLRTGDCRLVLSDIASNSVPLILTDPPYEDGAEPLWQWLGSWAMDVLMPGGSLICYFGGANVNKLYRILDDAGLTHWWHCVMMHEQAQRLAGKFVTINSKPVLWYVKEFRRGRTLVPDVVYSNRRNKGLHAWGQGEGGITQWIHQLTDPGETIVDPFCGTGEWGLITCREGRNWVGSDIIAGGTTAVVAGELENSVE
jgi:site-specific DNA-methyltransferase (adenine-specific)